MYVFDAFLSGFLQNVEHTMVFTSLHQNRISEMSNNSAHVQRILTLIPLRLERDAYLCWINKENTMVFSSLHIRIASPR